MGNDGGSIPTRRELVKEAARNPTITQIKESQLETQEYHWTTDPVSQKPLSAPIVADCHGKLYNKDTILEYLVEGALKEDVEAVTKGSVKSLKDVVEVKFEAATETESDAAVGSSSTTWRCPVTGDRLGPGSKAVYLVPCGHAFSSDAIKEVSGEKCLTCETEYASNDIIPIIPTSEDDIARLVLRMKTLQEKGLTHSLKKASGSKKRKKKDDEQDDTGPSTQTNESVKGSKPKGSNINNASTASLTARVLQEQEQAKKRKVDNKVVQSLFSSREADKLHKRNSDFMTRGYDLPSGGKR